MTNDDKRIIEQFREKLAELFFYDAETGLIINRVDRGYNSLMGSEAGTLRKDSGYRELMIAGKTYKSHRLALLMSGVNLTRSTECDHVNGIRDDNRLCNLRVVTKTENMRNTKIQSNNTSALMGVHWKQSARKWQARISHCGKRISLGHFTEKYDAICARHYAEIDYGYHPNHGRVA